jgi:hypothetical protein
MAATEGVMIIIKGIAFGLVMFIVFSILYLWACGMLGGAGAVTVEATNAVITHNYLYWTIGALMLVLGCLIVAIWPVRVLP